MKMDANYAEIGRVGKLKALFSIISTCTISLEFSQTCHEIEITKSQQKKLKKKKKNNNNIFS